MRISNLLAIALLLFVFPLGQRVGQAGIIAQEPMEGSPGTIFVQWGTGFTPNSTAILHFLKPDGTEYPTVNQAIDNIGHFETTYTVPSDKPPGIYTWWAIDGPTGGRSNDVSYIINAEPVIAQTPENGTAGTQFVQWGTGFTPNSTAILHFLRPDGTEYPTVNQAIDNIGHFETTYTVPSDKPPGTYTWWAIDGPTGGRSNDVSYIINAEPVIAQTSENGTAGSQFVQWGTGFTPNSTAILHFLKSDGTEYPTVNQAIDNIGHFETTYTVPSDKPPGTYTWWAIDGPTGGRSNDVSYIINAEPVIAQTPENGTAGTQFVQWGTGFTPNSTVILHFLKPDGTEYPTVNQPIDNIGHFETTYTAPSDKPPGTYTWWAIDGPTGGRSNDVSYIINAEPVIAQTPENGTAGTQFVQWGTGFTPNSTVILHFLKPDGTEYPTVNQPIDNIGHFETTYTAPSDKPPGTYTWWAIDGPTGGRSNDVSYIINTEPVIAQTPENGPPGTRFIQWGSGFTPDSIATLHIRKPDGTEYDPVDQFIDSIGHFELNYFSSWDKPPGDYTWWVVDEATGKKSNEVTYQITAPVFNPDIQIINPQSDEIFYDNFFPAPHPEQLIDGGTPSRIIATDGISRLLIRIISNTAGEVTISESAKNPQQNGSLSHLADHRKASRDISSVTVKTEFYDDKHVAFAVYRTPDDFFIPDYENRLHRSISLDIQFPEGSETVEITLRRPPIVYSHGLWSNPFTEDIIAFRNALWNKFTDRNGKLLMDYLWPNDCLAQNSLHLINGGLKTQNNLKTLLRHLRRNGVTVTQVDYLGHSMGGLWARFVGQRYSKDPFTYDKGYFHKLITLNTPHMGSFIANIGQFALDNALNVQIPGWPTARDYLCYFSNNFAHPICLGAIEDLTSEGTKDLVQSVVAPSYAIVSDKSIDTACLLLTLGSKYPDPHAKAIAKVLKIIEKILKSIDPEYGCTNWVNMFDIPTSTDYVVGIESQKGSLEENHLKEFDHWHSAAFSTGVGSVNDYFFNLLNTWSTDSNVFAEGFPASGGVERKTFERVVDDQTPYIQRKKSERIPIVRELLFIEPIEGASVSPGDFVEVKLSKTELLELESILLMMVGNDYVELFSEPYTTNFQIPYGFHGELTIAALGLGVDGNLYSASVTLNVINTATLERIAVSPEDLFLDVGQAMQLQVTGFYSDDSVRDLSPSSEGTVYKSGNDQVVAISEDGVVTAISPGETSILIKTASGDEEYISVEVSSEPYIRAEFSAEEHAGFTPFTVQFSDQSAGYFSEWYWDFGDGQTSIEQNPAHIYTSPGTYSVSLTVTGSNSSDTKICTDCIEVRDATDLDKAILSLKIVVGIDVGEIVSELDGTQDDWIGLEDAIFFLQKVAEIRPENGTDCSDLCMDVAPPHDTFDNADIEKLQQDFLTNGEGKDINSDGVFSYSDVVAAIQCYNCLWDWEECGQ